MAVWGCVGRLRAGSMKDVLSAPHGANPRFSNYVPYDAEKKSPALGGGGAVDGSHVSMSVILPAGRQRKPKVAVKRWSTRHRARARPVAHDLYCPLHCKLRRGERARLVKPNRTAAVRANAVPAVQGRMVANRARMRAHSNRNATA